MACPKRHPGVTPAPRGAPRRGRARRSVAALAFGALLACAAGLFAAAGAQDNTDQADSSSSDTPVAMLAEINGVIGPATAKYLADAIETAQERKAEVLILRIDTPGGLATSMRDMISDILGARIPVIGHVAPPGARAASAGTYIMYATHVAAMAPGTNMGAATPVQIGGGGLPGMPSSDKPKKEEKDKSEDKSGEQDKSGGSGSEESGGGSGESDSEAEKQAQPADASKSKAVNDAVAFIRSLAELRGRNVDWAEKAVREAASISADQALEQNVIDLVADGTDQLLDKLDGHEISIGETTRTLSTKGLSIERIEPSFMTKLLGILANPNVALILMMIGVYGLIFEFSHPGTIGPGIVGVICLVLGLYALNQLPLDYAGLGLVFFGVALMVAEAMSPTFGVLGTGGIAAFVLGSAMLIDTDVPQYQVSWAVIAAMAGLSGGVLILLLGYVWRSLRRPLASGDAELVETPAEVMDWSGREGHVWSRGERWNARSQGGASFRKGERVRVKAMDGLTLLVAPLSGKRKRRGDKAQRQRKGN